MAIIRVSLVLVGIFLVFTYVSSTPASPQGVKMPPQAPQLSGKPTLQPQMSGQVVKCQVQDYERVPCGEPGISGESCTTINCCFDGQQCYYGKTVTVQCTLDGQFVLVVARDTTVPRISLESISMLGGNSGPCSPVDSNTAFAIYQFPVTACGTTMMVQGGYVVYENRMISSYEVGVGPRGAITRDTHYELYFQCKYSGVSLSTLAIDPSANADPPSIVASGPLQVELRLGNGHCVAKGCVEDEVAYTSYYSAADYPVTKVLRNQCMLRCTWWEELIQILSWFWEAAGRLLPLTPTAIPSGTFWCPYKDDRYLTKLMPVNGMSRLAYPTHYRRFVLKMFTFVDPGSMAPMHEMFYIHCSTAVCLPTAQDSCEPTCARRRRDAAAEGSPHTSGIVSSGGVIFTQSSSPQFV
ncbi:hypothetical protein AMELA_G00106670 [Ameiurus melas]|uniref:Zona pellucida sperm-binding protein 4 n=1 Tax=Ameiurus melas TaxID=219545 RepID=A0A7J6AUV1_AMEME|nr:hypothetical protein AMELA_G00106670 [Ameiurus melas]